MTSKRGLVYQGLDLWRDPASRQRLIVQLSVLTIVLLVSAFYHFVLGGPSSKRKLSPIEGVLDEKIATVHRLFVYPIKSCAGVELRETTLSAKGFEFDRRWIVLRVKEGENGQRKLEKLSLREEPRLTLIQPKLLADCMRLSISKHAKDAHDLPTIDVPLRPSRDTLEAWPRVPTISMWGDQADGREVQLLDAAASQWKGSPSEWISKFLGYPCLLIQFDPFTSIKRKNFPIFKPPHDLRSWDAARREDLERLRPIEFQDEYPLLVATQESLDAINAQISRAIADPTTDGHGGASIKMFDAQRYAHLIPSSSRPAGEAGSSAEEKALITAFRFRPNVLLKSLHPASGGYKEAVLPYSEDSWERFWIESDDNEKGKKADVALVARCKRCLLTTVDPETAERDVSLPLAFLRRSRQRDKTLEGEKKMGPCWGCYGVVLPVGEAVGDRGGGGGAGARGSGGKRDQGKEGRGGKETGERYGQIKVGDEVWVRWRPLAEDDEPERSERWEARMRRRGTAS